MFYIRDQQKNMVNIANFDGLQITKGKLKNKENPEEEAKEIYTVIAWWRSKIDEKNVNSQLLFAGSKEACEKYLEGIWELIQGKKKRLAKE